MARIENLELDARGRKRRAELEVSGDIVWEDSELSLNGAELIILLRGVDQPDDVDTRNLVGGFAQWIAKGRSDTVRYDDLNGILRFTSESPTRTNFNLEVHNENKAFWNRSFNEDIPGRDEIIALVRLRNIDDGSTIASADSNVVRGRF